MRQFGNRCLFAGREWSELGSRDIDGKAERPRERARTSQWLSDLHLYDYRNRMYQPELGRFLQPDPKEFGAGDYNLYRYCHNDPVNKTDPFGLIPPGEGLIDLPKDVLDKMYKDNRANNTDSATKPDHQNGKPIKEEYRRDQYRTKDGLRSNSRMGYRDNTQPKNAPPKNIFGEKAKLTSITHSHITGSFRHLPHDRDVADDAHVPSGVGYIGDNGAHMEIYVPSAGSGRGGTFYTDDGMHVYDIHGNPAPH